MVKVKVAKEFPIVAEKTTQGKDTTSFGLVLCEDHKFGDTEYKEGQFLNPCQRFGADISAMLKKALDEGSVLDAEITHNAQWKRFDVKFPSSGGYQNRQGGYSRPGYTKPPLVEIPYSQFSKAMGIFMRDAIATVKSESKASEVIALLKEAGLDKKELAPALQAIYATNLESARALVAQYVMAMMGTGNNQIACVKIETVLASEKQGE